MKHMHLISFVASVAVCATVIGSVTAQVPPPDQGPLPEQNRPIRPEGAAPDGTESVTAILGTTFTYQGQLKQGGVPANGTCDMAFRLYDNSLVGSQIGNPISTTVPVVAGLFTVGLNFGSTPFEGDARWLEIRVRCPSGSGSHVTLSPRQQLTPAPYALSLRPGATISATTSGNVLNLENYGVSSGRAAYFRNSGGSSSATLRVDNEGNSWGIYATSNGGTAVEGISDLDIGVIGRHSATTGTLPALAGYTASTSANAVGVLGQVNSTAPGASSVGVRGLNNGAAGLGIGVWGSQNGSGWGVYGEAPSGRGVYGNSTNGIGVYAFSGGAGVNNAALFAYNSRTGAEPSGIAVYAQNASADSTIVARNTSGADTLRSLNAAGNSVIFRVTGTGRVIASAVQIYGGGDLAERFETTEQTKTEPGTLMVIDEANPGKLKVSMDAYDRKVAGVVSGAGGVNPGMTLHQQEVMDGDTVVAIAGRVYVKADARNGAIKPGDLLTTSDLPGHAMRVTNMARAQGAIIGKAMTGLKSGTGLVLVLVNLQ